MKHAEFLNTTQAVSQFDSTEAVESFVQSVFEVLANRIYGNEAKDLASQLPEEIAQYLRGHEGENGTYMDLQTFYSRIAERSQLDVAEIPQKVRGLFAVIQKAVTPGQFDHLKVNLSDEYAELFAPPSRQHLE
ncbi:MAG: DUF2267 domain-containing protein [Leptolyngbyaceae cyanobacterium SM1_1_3]|nr:DUF2267 domain-containing protein [Leptolyngbyaceae cyanobacterium SM1_1_3]NJN02508.1 DUF2267 domain-containing protein [Leptolyngbyaceae cyanobacterium RM1_1_2]NJO11047.1 DUF2267 domain-containing protein [Leptolyngbyaceae cyanobacterium SL_1_1]